MRPLFSYQKTRFTAAVMLFVWLLVLGTGIANACLAHEDHARYGYRGQGHAGQSTLYVADNHRNDADHPSVWTEQADGDHDAVSARTACEKVCATEQASAVKPQVEKLAPSDLAPVLAATWWDAPLIAVHAVGPPNPRLVAWPGLPVFIRFLRLTL